MVSHNLPISVNGGALFAFTLNLLCVRLYSTEALDVVFIKIKIKTFYRSIGMFYIAFCVIVYYCMAYIIYYQIGHHIPPPTVHNRKEMLYFFPSTFEQFIAIDTVWDRKKTKKRYFHKTIQQQTRKLSAKIFRTDSIMNYSMFNCVKHIFETFDSFSFIKMFVGRGLYYYSFSYWIFHIFYAFLFGFSPVKCNLNTKPRYACIVILTLTVLNKLNYVFVLFVFEFSQITN